MIQQCCRPVIYIFPPLIGPVFLYKEADVLQFWKKKKRVFSAGRKNLTGPSCVPPTSRPPYLSFFFPLRLHFCWRFLKATLRHGNPLKSTSKCLGGWNHTSWVLCNIITCLTLTSATTLPHCYFSCALEMNLKCLHFRFLAETEKSL